MGQQTVGAGALAGCRRRLGPRGRARELQFVQQLLVAHDFALARGPLAAGFILGTTAQVQQTL